MSKDTNGTSNEYNPNKASTIPVSIRNMTKEQFDAEIQLGMNDIQAGRVISADDVEAVFLREHFK